MFLYIRYQGWQFLKCLDNHSNPQVYFFQFIIGSLITLGHNVPLTIGGSRFHYQVYLHFRISYIGVDSKYEEMSSHCYSTFWSHINPVRLIWITLYELCQSLFFLVLLVVSNIKEFRTSPLDLYFIYT